MFQLGRAKVFIFYLATQLAFPPCPLVFSFSSFKLFLALLGININWTDNKESSRNMQSESEYLIALPVMAMMPVMFDRREEYNSCGHTGLMTGAHAPQHLTTVHAVDAVGILKHVCQQTEGCMSLSLSLCKTL